MQVCNIFLCSNVQLSKQAGSCTSLMQLLTWMFSDWPYWCWGSCSKAFKQSHVCMWDWGERYWETPVLNLHLLKTRLLVYFLHEDLQPSCSEKLGRDYIPVHGPKPAYSGEVSFHTWFGTQLFPSWFLLCWKSCSMAGSEVFDLQAES